VYNTHILDVVFLQHPVVVMQNSYKY